MPYIYKITNTQNGKSYIGKTVFTLERRFQEHKNDSQKEKNSNRPLYRALHKYGIQNFTCECIEEVDNTLLSEREQYWIKYFGTYHNGYNATMGGDGGQKIDYDKVVEVYQKTRNQNETAILLDICSKSVTSILELRGIITDTSRTVSKRKFGKPVSMFDLNNNHLQDFLSLKEAAQYMVDNQLTGCKLETIRTHIAEVCNEKRKTASGFKWKFII